MSRRMMGRGRARRALGAGLLGGGQSYADYVQSLSPLMWFRFQEPSGTTADNAGIGGAALDGTASGAVTVGQTGVFGANEAYDFAASSNGVVTVPQDVAWTAATDYTVGILFKPDSALALGSRLYSATRFDASFPKLTDLIAFQQYSTSNATSTTVDLDFTGSNYGLLFVTHTDADSTMRIYHSYDGTIAEVSYTAQTAGVGSQVTPTHDLGIGNNTGGTRPADGLIDEFYFWDSLLTTAEMEAIAGLIW